MGASASTLSSQEISELQQCTHFSATELFELYQRFERLDRDRSGTLSAEEFLCLPEFAMNPLAPRILDFIGAHESELDFTGFAQLLSVFHKSASTSEKLLFTFQIYNLSGDGRLKRDELLTVLRMMAGSELSEDELMTIVDETFAEADADRNGEICFEEFSAGLLVSEALKEMTIIF